MNELQAMAIAALEEHLKTIELERLRATVARLVEQNDENVPHYRETLATAEARHAEVNRAINWVKAANPTQLNHITTHKAAELRSRGYKDVGVVLQDDLGSTAVVAHGKVTWSDPVSVTSTIAQQSQFVPWTDKDVRELHAVLDQYPPATTSIMTAQPTATPCGQVTTTETGKHTCTTMRVGDSKICPDCNPKRNFLEWLGEQQPSALASQAQQPTKESVNKLRDLADQCKVAASCLTYNGARAEAVAKHLLLEASQGLRRSQAQQKTLKVSENWREPLSADAMQRLKNLGVLDKPLPPAPEGVTK